MSFKYEKNAADVGRIKLIIGIIALLACIALQYLVLKNPGIPVLVSPALWVIAGVIVYINFKKANALFNTYGKWVISIDANKITWHSPDESVDHSFTLMIKDIENIVVKRKRINRKIKRVGSKKSVYVIVSQSGKEYELSSASGVNLSRVFAELERLGVRRTTEKHY